MTQKDRKLDLFELIRNAESRNFDYFSTLSDAQKHEFSPWLAMRFMSSAPNDNGGLESLLLTDVVLNEHFTIMSRDKEFFYRLMCVAGGGTIKRHSMIKPPKGKMKPQIINDLFAELIDEPMTATEIDTYMEINGLEMRDLADIAEDLGWDVDKIKLLKKSGVTT